MDSEPIQQEEEANELDTMQFDLDEQLLKVQKSDVELDQELLQI